ncbi:MAG: hypothetical protein KDA52_20265, partial [Planctomycetaceae bacterium]|nr:hypothetical protein [Planctomycetaceae bacterium]
ERIITRGDQLYIYYCGVHGAHGGPTRKNIIRKHPVQIGLLNQRRDGFVSLDTDTNVGRVTTKPFTLPQGQLHINADATDGELRVKLLDQSGRTIAHSNPITGDVLDQTVPFGQALPAAGEQVSLTFKLRNSKLYSYWFE